MEIPAQYDPSVVETRWYDYWIENSFFNSSPDEREPYTITIPPPNVTGVLHMGHMLNNTIQDVLIRRARMKGFNACWVPGTDHASIATEAKVVSMLRERGINKSDLSRQEFLKYAWEWTDKHGGIILQQLRRLGASCDWERTVFTMDNKRYESVINVFIDLYNKGLIYRGIRMVNWDPQAQTALSDEEVNYTEESSFLYYVRYAVTGSDDFITIATTRPETILGDTALCANPADSRYSHLKGKSVVVPMVNREVPFIYDDYVEMEFGTGCLKITPAHDINDYEIGLRHNLQVIDIFNSDGTLSPDATLLTGEDRFVAREKVIEMLRESGALVKVEEYRNKIGRSERTNAVIEPRLSVQWFLKMKDLARPALDAVNSGDIAIHPPKFANVYRHWMENVHDWCISRQLWWGHRIPAWYYGNGRFVVAETAEKALEIARRESGDHALSESDLKQDEDVLDTWFSSWLWPIAAFDGINQPGNKELEYYYPTNDLVTAPEILFFWVARMIIAGYEYMDTKPFSNVYLHGLVRDKKRRKMSKSLGNSPEPLELIERFGADGVRVGMLFCSPAGNDLLYDDSLPGQGRNFCNKIWNAFRLVKSWEPDQNLSQPEWSAVAVRWMDNVIDRALISLDDNFSKFRISDCLMTLYRLFWEEFSSWYLEIIKPVKGKKIDTVTYEAVNNAFEKLMLMMHPFMPFISEEIWQLIKSREEGESIMITEMPSPKGKSNDFPVPEFDMMKEVVTGIRAIRKEKKIPNRDSLTLLFSDSREDFGNSNVTTVIKRLCNIDDIRVTGLKPSDALSFMVGTTEFYIPFSEGIDTEAEKYKIKKEIDYYTGFLNSVNRKLGNPSFIENAPATVVETERRKKSDAESKLKSLGDQLTSLG